MIKKVPTVNIEFSPDEIRKVLETFKEDSSFAVVEPLNIHQNIESENPDYLLENVEKSNQIKKKKKLNLHENFQEISI
jgi:hypothetical protein